MPRAWGLVTAALESRRYAACMQRALLTAGCTLSTYTQDSTCTHSKKERVESPARPSHRAAVPIW